MADKFNKVSLVVDRDYGSRLESLVTDAVWIIDTPANRMAAEAQRQEKEEADVTTFKSTADTSADIALGILNTVDLHHGEYSGGYSSLEVIGTQLTEELKSAIKELGFSRFESTTDGFRASR